MTHVTCALAVAIDMSPVQNALLEIKLAAIRHLEYRDYLCLLGEKAETQGSHSRYSTFVMSQFNHYLTPCIPMVAFCFLDWSSTRKSGPFCQHMHKYAPLIKI